MKREVAEWVSKCYTCQRVKAEYQRPSGLLQPLEIPEWKWEHIAMDFIVGLPRTRIGMYSVFVVVDRFGKMSHYIPCKTTHDANNFANLFFKEVVRIHGLPRSIVAHMDVKFMGYIWKTLWERLGKNLAHSSAYHPQTNG